MFRKPRGNEWIFLAAVAALYASGLLYVLTHGLSVASLFEYGLLQPRGIVGNEARLVEIATPLSWDLLQVAWFVYIKAAAVLVELFQYWIVGMLIAGALIVFVPWETVKRKMGAGGFWSNLMAAMAGAVIPICSCGIVPVLAGMVESGIPLGPTMAFLIAAPMINLPAIFMTAGILGWKLALGRILGSFAIALAVGGILSYWQSKERFLRRFIRLSITPSLPPGLQQFAFETGMTLSAAPGRMSTEQLAPGKEEDLFLLAEAGVLDRGKDGLWHLPKTVNAGSGSTGACFVLPGGDEAMSLRGRLRKLLQTGWDFFLQLNYYLVLAVLIAGAIKVLLPTSIVVGWLGGDNLNSVFMASIIAVLAYVCTYVEIPTALALIQKGMGGGATLAYLLGGPGLSLPSIAMLSGVFTPRVLAVYVGVSFLGCITAGVLFNLF